MNSLITVIRRWLREKCIRWLQEKRTLFWQAYDKRHSEWRSRRNKDKLK